MSPKIELGFDYANGKHIPTIKISFEPCGPEGLIWDERDLWGKHINKLFANHSEEPLGVVDPVAWRHTMHFEEGCGYRFELTDSAESPFGKPDVDYDKSFSVICEPLYTSPPAPVAVVMSFDFEHPLSKEKRTVTLIKQEVYDGMEDYFYDKLAEQICQCESVGETNVVDCNCDEYIHDFELVADKVKELNQ